MALMAKGEAARRLAGAVLGACLAGAALGPTGAKAQEAAAQQEVYDNATSTRNGGVAASSIANTLPRRGDPYGIRQTLARHGFSFDVIYTGEVLGNVKGGLRRGSLYGGKLEANFAGDLEKALGLPGLSFYVNAFQIHQTRGINRNLVGNLNTISAIEALPSTRLSEAWLEQRLFGGLASIRFGQLAADTEFTIANYSLPFMSSDWPGIMADNLPGGGAAYPFATPGIRLRIDPDKQSSLLFGLYNGDPAGPSSNPETRNRTGTNFRMKDPALLLAEYQYRTNQGDKDTGLARIVRLGGWSHLGRFDSQRFDVNGLSLASPGSVGIAARYRGDAGLYGIIDQQLYRPEGGSPNDGIAMFTRLFVSPNDRNLIGLFWDAGILASGLVPGRPNDQFGVTFLYAKLGRDAAAYDRDFVAQNGLGRSKASGELSVEFSYVAEIRHGWTIQPSITHVVRPGGGRARIEPTTGLALPPPKDATVLGLRTTIFY
ncbi:carbohydrate porin [Enterovirga rhinocerotis]|nr:carbohydrate porin [Enterovirga rhinocerotis]